MHKIKGGPPPADPLAAQNANRKPVPPKGPYGLQPPF